MQNNKWFETKINCCKIQLEWHEILSIEWVQWLRLLHCLKLEQRLDKAS